MSRMIRGAELNIGVYALMRASDWHFLMHAAHVQAIGTPSITCTLPSPLLLLHAKRAPVAIAHLHHTRISVMAARRPECSSEAVPRIRLASRRLLHCQLVLMRL